VGTFVDLGENDNSSASYSFLWLPQQTHVFCMLLSAFLFGILYLEPLPPIKFGLVLRVTNWWVTFFGQLPYCSSYFAMCLEPVSSHCGHIRTACQTLFTKPSACCFFAIGDLIACGVIFSGACAAAGITVLIAQDLLMCSENHCSSFQTAVSMAFMCSFSLAPSFVLNFWSTAFAYRVVAAG